MIATVMHKLNMGVMNVTLTINVQLTYTYTTNFYALIKFIIALNCHG